jgi:hypothetical protein
MKTQIVPGDRQYTSAQACARWFSCGPGCFFAGRGKTKRYCKTDDIPPFPRVGRLCFGRETLPPCRGAISRGNSRCWVFYTVPWLYDTLSTPRRELQLRQACSGYNAATAKLKKQRRQAYKSLQPPQQICYTYSWPHNKRRIDPNGQRPTGLLLPVLPRDGIGARIKQHRLLLHIHRRVPFPRPRSRRDSCTHCKGLPRFTPYVPSKSHIQCVFRQRLPYIQ